MGPDPGATPVPRPDDLGDTVAKSFDTGRIDPTWPDLPDGEHPLTELLATAQGSLSPFGELEFPLPSVPYEHPVTEINR